MSRIKFDISMKDIESHPLCEHGPTLLFTNNQGKKSFYRCAAFRDKKSCKINVREIESKLKLGQRMNYRRKFREFISLPLKERFYCIDCSLILSSKLVEKHLNHNLIHGVSKKQLRQPSKLLRPLQANKNEAQYFFSESTLKFISDTINNLQFKNLICIGVQTVHEYFRCNHKEIRSLLLDIDSRLMQFYASKQFLCYNMFNNYFLEGQNAIVKFKSFLSECKANETLILIDPPFGGFIKAIAFSISQINKLYINVTEESSELPVMLFFPYFNEKHVRNSMPSLKLMDYKVCYENHCKFSDYHQRKRKQGSPVRIFTNIEPRLFQLPESEGYKYCSDCDRYVSAENKHCVHCNRCTSKDGRESIHCLVCKKCVKNTWKHCSVCGMCSLPHEHL